MTAPGPGARSLLIRGDEGIGKTAVWRRGVEEHCAAGHRILVTRPCEDELHVPMTGLIDLLEDADPQGDLLARDADVFERGRSVEQTLRRLASDARSCWRSTTCSGWTRCRCALCATRCAGWRRRR